MEVAPTPELEPDPDEPPPAATPPIVLRAATALLGAGSGGVLGMLTATLVGAVWPGARGTPVPVTAGLVVFLAIAMAMVNLRQPPPPPSLVPRAAWAVVFNSLALLLTLGVFLFQSAYIQGTNASGTPVRLPLPVWPMAQAALVAALALVILGLASAIIAWIEVATLGCSTGAKWLAHSLLIGGAWLGLALVCYVMGHGLAFF